MDIFRIAFEDIQNVFGIKENLYEMYVEREIFNNEDLLKLINYRDSNPDWTKETPLGGMGTTLNAFVLYCLIRYYFMYDVIETGISGGFYSAFILAALDKNDNNYKELSLLTSLEISTDTSEIGKLVPKHFGNFHQNWSLKLGRSSLDIFKDWKANGTIHNCDLYCHDSLHTMNHMLKELQEFKEHKWGDFFIFIDDQNSDLFWQKCLRMDMFKKEGYDVKYISGNESRLNGHLGGFIKYNEVKDV